MFKVFREPLLHFVILGAVLFGLYGWMQGSALKSSNEIVVSSGQLQSLRAQFERLWHRPATAQELQGLVDSWIREEIFYREGLAMGLERDDPVVRRRIQQKVEFIVDGTVPPTPTSAELQAWLDSHSADYESEPVLSLQQVYFDPSKHGSRLTSELTEARRVLQSGKTVRGDVTQLPETLEGVSASEARSVFGPEFAIAVLAMPVGDWQGPVTSAFGLHLVRVTRRSEGRALSLQEVRNEVERDLLHARTREAADAYYTRLRSGYVVRIEGALDNAEVPGG